ncbi:MAG TPA: methylamine dehydrogenase light chain [Actinomycetota bacterium]|nr:methylamine dehydrogenase light chain [Actinomycetota bacterium]
MDLDERQRREALEEGGSFDRFVSRGLADASQRLSRRGVLAKAGKVVLGVLGVSTGLAALPLDRAGADSDTEIIGGCDDWKLCGLWGRLCNCCNGTAGIGTCPGCADLNPGHFWTSCCCKPSANTMYWIRYYDCCNGCPSSKVDECKTCRTCWKNPVEQPEWCYTTGVGTGQYVCTTVVKMNSCGMC